jgi:hypothetical protein
MSRPWCKHYRGMHENTQCEAGVAFDSLEHHGTKLFWESCPCFGPEASGKCESAAYPTAEEMAAHDAEMTARFERTCKARDAIVEHLGGPWKRGTPASHGTMDCPVCNAVGSLRFSRASYNGHIHAKCKTAGCVSWME